MSWLTYGNVWIDEMALVEGDKPLPAPEGTPRDERKPAEYFVSSSIGNDNNDGLTTAHALKSVMLALLRAAPGSTVTLLAGRYEGGWVMKPGEAGKPTTLRAERAGRVFVGSSEIFSGFKPVPGCEYSWARPFPAGTNKLRELDTGTELKWMATSVDVEEVVASYCYDEHDKRLYVHPSDSAGTDHHIYAAILDKTGITVANHTVVDGLVMTGFGNSAIAGERVTDVIVRNCKIYRNGGGISLVSSKNCIVRDNEAWENRPDYSEGSQIFFTGDTEGMLVEGNTVHHGLAGRMGIRCYSGDIKNNVFRGNVIWDANDNCFKGMGVNNLAERNVCIGGGLGAVLMRYNTYSAQVLAVPDPRTDLRLWEEKGDLKFADPAWQDYRLQSDSPARGKGKDGTDLGAYQYKRDVFFVKPDGDDQAEGASLAGAWKTLAHAAKAIQPGQTLYVLPGRYDEPLCLTGKSGAAGKKTTVRVHGQGKAWVRGVKVTHSACLELANFSTTAEPGEGFQITRSRNVTLLHCASYLNKGHGLGISGSEGVSIQHCALWRNAGAGVYAHKSSDLEVTSSLAAGNQQGQILLTEGTQGYYGNFNALGGEPLGRTATANSAANDLAEWRKQTGSEDYSLLLSDKPNDPEKGDFSMPAAAPASFVGLYNSPAGPDGVVATKKVARQPIEDVEVVSVTRTSANLLWKTPGRMTGTVLDWGLTPQYGNRYDRGGVDGKSEYVLVHTASLINLKPETTYHFRAGYRDFDTPDGRLVWSADHTFRTSKEDPRPRQLYVSTTGDDSEDGLTRQTAWRTLHKASREAHAGDTVNILPGRYVELLCPLQTGTGEDKRITFRGARPLSVLLDGGACAAWWQGARGRPHSVLLCGKAFVTIENIAGVNFCRNTMDFGGYRGGCGYAGIFRMSGGAMNEFKGCVADSRDIAVGFAFFDGGLMPDPNNAKYSCAAHVTDSATVNCWRGVLGFARSPLLLDHNIYLVSITGMYDIWGGAKKSWISRDCIYQDIDRGKRQGSGCWPFTNIDVIDSDYGDFAWMPLSVKQVARGKDGKPILGLAAWQKASGQDAHSVEITPDYPLPALEQSNGYFDKRPLTINDFILSKGSPLRTAGTDGGPIGVRWDQWLGK
ncbi:MAG: right-handed parallel beta-helix repeat-containing protein [Thermoguttaceae bacterium]